MCTVVIWILLVATFQSPQKPVERWAWPLANVSMGVVADKERQIWFLIICGFKCMMLNSQSPAQHRHLAHLAIVAWLMFSEVSKPRLWKV
jgi:hypothetical protein